MAEDKKKKFFMARGWFWLVVIINGFLNLSLTEQTSLSDYPAFFIGSFVLVFIIWFVILLIVKVVKKIKKRV